MMRIMKNMNKRMSKPIIALLMCAVMVISLVSVGSVSYATENDITINNQTTSEDTSQTGSSTNNGNSSTNTDPNGTLGKNSEVGIEVTKSITGKSGKEVTVAFVLKSNNPANIKLKSVYPVIDNTFPFETSGDAYKIITAGDKEEKQKTLDASFKMTARNDLTTGYHSVRFIGEYQKVASDGSVQDFYVIKTINIYFTSGSSDSGNSKDKDKDKDKNKEQEEDSGDDEDSGDFDDSYDDGGDSYDGGDGGYEEEAVAPKLIITGYETDPEKIMAGQTFTITIHVQNTSKTTNVCNGKFLVGNETGSFTPTNGSNAVFVESIKAGETGDIVMEMKAGADLSQKNYSLVVKGDFDDGRGNNFNSSDSLTIPVYQKVDFNITEVSMAPEVIGVGEEGSLMFTINNQSTAGVYNVNVNVKDGAVSAEETYVGNIAGSSSAYATLLVTGVEENADTGKITIEITYEDSEGNKETIEKNVACMVGEGFDYEDDMGMEDGYDLEDEDGDDEWEDDESYFSPIWIVLIVLVVIGIIAGVIVFLVLRRKKRMAELLAEEDGEDDLYDENF